MLDSYGTHGKYINCELEQYRRRLSTTNSEELQTLIGKDVKLLVLDEAHSIKDFGSTLKILVDTFPDLQIIATGSSSIKLAQSLGEPLTGRARKYLMYPLSIQELAIVHDMATVDSSISRILRYGLYPSVYTQQSEEETIEEISDIAEGYLYKDILQYADVRKPRLLTDLLAALALQLGNEVSMSELSNHLSENVHVIKRYIDLLEKAFVIFRLPAFSRNPREEISHGQKIYFYDLGIRNYLINNFNPIELRTDAGALWENFCILERKKHNEYTRNIMVKSYFWRTYDQKEVDYVEELNGTIVGYEYKLKGNPKQKTIDKFTSTYPNATITVVNRQNYWQLIPLPTPEI